MHPRRRGRRSSRPRKGSFPASEEILYAEPLDFRLIGDPVALVEHVLETHFLALVATTFSDTDPHAAPHARSEEHTSELQSLMRTSYAVFCLKKKKLKKRQKQDE